MGARMVTGQTTDQIENGPEFIRGLLTESSLEAKLRPGPLEWSTNAAPEAWVHGFRFPARPFNLIPKNDLFQLPSAEQLEKPADRARLLHFFANHELQAIELMAWAVARFGHDPQNHDFCCDLMKTIRDEQDHLGLYVKRMQDFGLEFGDYAVNAFFWELMEPVTSPVEFSVVMGMTLEQANLDYCLHYQQLFKACGDHESAQIMGRVLKDEIQHVERGVGCFKSSLDPADHEQWDRYCEVLPESIPPRRAKGIGFNKVPREKAGLSPQYIQSLHLSSGSKGKVPDLWRYDPLCDERWAPGVPHRRPPAVQDLEHLPMFLAHPEDQVWVDQLPNPEWLEWCRKVGIELPQFVSGLEPPLGGWDRYMPWGWSQNVREVLGESAKSFRKLRFFESQLSNRELSEISSKKYTVDFLQDQESGGGLSWPWVQEVRSLEEIQSTGSRAGANLLYKKPWATAGQGVRRIPGGRVNGSLAAEISKSLQTQGFGLLEPELHREADLSLQIFVGDKGCEILGILHVEVGEQYDYRGCWMDPQKVSRRSRIPRAQMQLKTLSEEHREFLFRNRAGMSPLERWKALALRLGRELASRGFRGPAGLDAMIYRDNQHLVLHPLIELNSRWTMGHISLALSQMVHPGSVGRWRLESVGRIFKTHGSVESFIRKKWLEQPAVSQNGLWVKGFFPTQWRAKHIFSYLELRVP